MTANAKTIDVATRSASPQRGDKPIIALDMDDTMVQTAAGQMKAFKELWNIDLTPDDFDSISMFQNRGWGTPEEVQQKHGLFSAYVTQYPPAEGLQSAVKKLRALGFELHVVTARSTRGAWSVTGWLDNVGLAHGPGQDIEAIHFARDNDDHAESKKLVETANADVEAAQDEKDRKANRLLIEDHIAGIKSSALKKVDALNRIGAIAMVDDQLPLCAAVLEHTNAHCLLYGNYKWHKNFVDFSHPHDFLTWQERQDQGVELVKRPFPFENHERLHKVKDWDQVVKWAEDWGKKRA